MKHWLLTYVTRKIVFVPTLSNTKRSSQDAKQERIDGYTLKPKYTANIRELKDSTALNLVVDYDMPPSLSRKNGLYSLTHDDEPKIQYNLEVCL